MRWVILIFGLLFFSLPHCKSSNPKNSGGQNSELSAPIYHQDYANNPLFWYYWSNPNPVNLPTSGDPEDVRKMKEQEARRNLERNMNEDIKNTPSFQRNHHRNNVEPRLFD